MAQPVPAATWALVAAGGAVGAVLRYAVAQWVGRQSGGGWPWGTLAVNASGCFALGWLDARHLETWAYALLAVGGVGAYTTFSTFAYETLAALEARAWKVAWTNVGASVLLGALAYLGGRLCG